MTSQTAPMALLEAAAALLDVVPDPGVTLQVGLEAASRLLAGDRADGGWLAAGAGSYRPTRTIGVTCAPSPTFRVALDDPVITGVLAADHAIAVESIEEQLPSGPIRSLLLGMSTRSMAVSRLEHDGVPYGLVCIDWVDSCRDLDTDLLELFGYFTTRILSPVLKRAIVEHRPAVHQWSERLTSAEFEVACLAAAGNTYDQIAHRRGVSANTVSQQLRAARRKAGVSNTAELCARLGLAAGE